MHQQAANGPDMGFVPGDPGRPAAREHLACPPPAGAGTVRRGHRPHPVAKEPVPRDLEPYRGFHVFMRSLAALLAAHPTCQVLVVGGDEVSYGRPPKHAKSWREALLRELNIDTIFYPFVLSWSLLEAPASGCAVVASDTAPAREVIRHGENGWVVDFFEGGQIVDAVLKVLSDPSGMQAMRGAAVESIEERFAQAAGTAEHLSLLSCNSPKALGSNLCSELLREAQ